MMTYAQAVQFLYDLQMFGTKFGLENTHKLAALAGSPQEKLRFIHVAGTNGKGSTCAMLESIYRAAGWRTGLFTSPHLISLAERIQINRRLISETAVARLATEMKGWLLEFPATAPPTFFEVVTVMALQYFAEQKCDLVIWETGLGGRLDATNIVTPLASVITNVQFDHQKWLGDTLAKIAGEKAGVIKPGLPVVTGATEPEALAVIADTARERNSPLTLVTPADAQLHGLRQLALPLLGEHQWMNAAVARATVRCLEKRMPVSEEQIRQGLQTVDWPGRLQMIPTAAGQTLLLDGAHNVAGMKALCAALPRYFPHQKPALILGLLRDKDWEAMCQMLAPLATKIFLVPVPSQRTTRPEELWEQCRSANKEAVLALCGSLAEALAQIQQEPLTVVTGSLYLVGEALEILPKTPGKSVGERPLNEWFPASL